MLKSSRILLVFTFLIVLATITLHFKQKIDQQKFVERGKALASQVKYPPDYLVVLVGDSMTEYLGNSNELRVFMDDYYPGKTFDFLNYGFGSTNILSAEERLTKHTYHGRDFKPILEIPFDLILIESFGNNPLSEGSLQDGLKKQTETLDRIVKLISERYSKRTIVFVATIAPNSKKYGQGQVELSQEKRKQWADERTAYIKNHIEYAKTHNIPIINIYEKSLDSSGDGNLDYISKTDYIHPSPKGIIFISKQIADFIHSNKLLPN